MTLEQVDTQLRENKKMQHRLIQGMTKAKKQHLSTILELIHLSTHQEELERKRTEEIGILQVSIRKQISDGAKELYTSLPTPLKHILGEILTGNEYLVLAQTLRGNGITVGADTILKTGLTTNQARFIRQQKEQLVLITDRIKEYCNACKNDSCTSQCPLWWV